MTRREWLFKMGMMGMASMAPFPLMASHFDPKRERSLSLYNTHTSEMLTTVFWADGGYIPESLDAINILLRDHRCNEVCTMDIELMELLYSLSDVFGHRHSFHVISGYRSAQTNEALRQNSTGVAQNSFHTKGQAIDIYLPGVELVSLREAALSLSEGGVGYYPTSGFVHVDTGHVRSWPKPQIKPEEPLLPLPTPSIAPDFNEIFLGNV